MADLGASLEVRRVLRRTRRTHRDRLAASSRRSRARAAFLALCRGRDSRASRTRGRTGLTAFTHGGDGALEELGPRARLGATSTNGAMCARPVRYAVINSGVSSPESSDDVGDLDVLQARRTRRSAREEPGVFESGSVRVLSRMYQAGGSISEVAGDLVDDVFRGASIGASPNTVAITCPRGRTTRRISINACSGASMCEIANPLTAASKRPSGNGSAHMSPTTARHRGVADEARACRGEVSTANGDRAGGRGAHGTTRRFRRRHRARWRPEARSQPRRSQSDASRVVHAPPGRRAHAAAAPW